MDCLIVHKTNHLERNDIFLEGYIVRSRAIDYFDRTQGLGFPGRFGSWTQSGRPPQCTRKMNDPCLPSFFVDRTNKSKSTHPSNYSFCRFPTSDGNHSYIRDSIEYKISSPKIIGQRCCYFDTRFKM